MQRCTSAVCFCLKMMFTPRTSVESPISWRMNHPIQIHIFRLMYCPGPDRPSMWGFISLLVLDSFGYITCFRMRFPSNGYLESRTLLESFPYSKFRMGRWAVSGIYGLYIPGTQMEPIFWQKFDPPKKQGLLSNQNKGPHLGSIGIFFLLEQNGDENSPNLRCCQLDRTPDRQKNHRKGVTQKTLPCLAFFWGKTGSKQKKVNPSSAESHRIKNI